MNKLIPLMSTVIIFATLGCSTPYQPLQRVNYQWGFFAGPGGGYASRQTGENEFEVFFGGNRFTSIETVEKYWHRKAKELCGSDNYVHTMESKKTDSFPIAQGTVKCFQNP